MESTCNTPKRPLLPRIILSLLAMCALAAALLWTPSICPIHFASARIDPAVDIESVATLTGEAVDVTALLSATTQCSGRLCVNLELYAPLHPDLAEINAGVLLWSPKIAGTPAGDDYDPSTKDWASVVASCRAMFRHEKRLANFFIRSSFHDSMAVDVSNCPGPACGGADSSLLLTIDELTRPENAYDDFSLLTSRAAKKIASFFDISVADTLAVCAAVAPEVLSNGRIRILPANGTRVLPVGRLDSITPAPPGQLPPESAGVEQFVQFWNDRGISTAEAMALMGSHALLDTQGCLRSSNPRDYCNPETEDCTNVRMFRWENHYFKDLCSPTIKATVQTDQDPPEPLETPLLGMTEPEIHAEARVLTCTFTSNEGRSMALNELRLMQAGLVPEPPFVPPDAIVDWSNKNCTAGTLYGVPSSNCPHSASWLYTGNDAFLGQACQGQGSSPAHAAVRAATRSFLQQGNWDTVYRTAYIKMVSNFARFSPTAVAQPFNISGDECYSVTYLDAACSILYPNLVPAEGPKVYGSSGEYESLEFHKIQRFYGGEEVLQDLCKSCSNEICSLGLCESCASLFDAAISKPRRGVIPVRQCRNIWREYSYIFQSRQVVIQPFISRFPDILPSTASGLQPLPRIEGLKIPNRIYNDILNLDGIASTLTVAGIFSNPPLTPYHTNISSVCPSSHGTTVKVEGFPSSPFRWTPFTQPFTRPPPAQRANTYCKPGTNLCLDAYEIDIYPISSNLGCPSGPTRMLSYNGSVPGPTIRAVVGRQTLVRFNNRLTPSALTGTPFSAYTPCDTTAGRQGRPISVHLHGEASLAPYDGWADDTTCAGESKDYYYPNRRQAFGWYHDHQLEITSENAYFGLSGMYVMTDKAAEGGCGEPWNLDNLPDTEMQFKDAVLDSSCQLLYDRSGPHRNNLYGDINMVNGVPWPVMSASPRWNRFRWLNSAVARPFKIRIVDSMGNDVSSTVCKVIAGDGGLRRTPAAFPAAGLFMGVAERYEVVCDFSVFPGRTLFVMNIKEERRMKAVPFFCHSHLLMKINVATLTLATGSAFYAPTPLRATLDAVLNSTEISRALDMARHRQCTRTFRFGRRHGHWVINGETWHTARVAAGNVGQNTWEVWCLETGGGWFHPIHIHLVDFYVLTRNHQEAQVHEYERWTPKDVVQLDPSAHISLLVRFGPHRGEYMFHCHNLIHEDFEMMRSFHVKHTSAGTLAMRPTALPMQSQPTLVVNMNVVYDLYDDPVHTSHGPRPTSSLTPLRTLYNTAVQYSLSYSINNGIYRIFYPGGAVGESPLLYNRTINPWLVSLPTTSRC